MTATAAGSEDRSLSHRPRFEQHYAEGNTPCDTQRTPPEVVAFWMTGRLPWAGRALDLGCGPGTNVRYLARVGLDVIGVDFVAQPLLTARQRVLSGEPRIARRAQVILADVTRLPFSGLGASYILDVGCLHGIPPEARAGYVQGVLANLASGGYYQLYAFDRVPELEADPERIRGMTEHEVAERFGDDMKIVEVQRARPDRYPCQWYLLRRR